MIQATSVVRFAATFFLAVLTSVASTSALAADMNVKILRASGAVKLLSAGKPVPATPGVKVGLPLKIETGADGSLRVEQSSGTIDIGPNSTVLLPGLNGDKETVVQSLGRALYSIKPRKARTFAVETPYLVSVVKGTVFSVAIEDSTTSVSLLEGSVELVADGIDPVLLQPNETARRGAADRVINVAPIEVSRPIARAETGAVARTNEVTPGAPSLISDSMLADLNEVAVVRRDTSTRMIESPPPSSPIPTSPETQPPPQPAPQLPEQPQPPQVPAPSPVPDVTPPTPAPPIPGTTPSPSPPVPTPSDDHDHCGRKKCDSRDDDDRGHGNDRDDDDHDGKD